jgi:hypothetical protein
LAGQQQVAKFREKTKAALNTVELFLAVIRLPQVATELLITVNVPLVIGPESSSHTANPVQSSPDAQPTTTTTSHASMHDLQIGEAHLRTLLSSININDWHLFQ